MISIRLVRTVFATLLVAALCGCLPTGSSQVDEEKEPHFQRGRERVNAMDYGGAIESFEKALEVNPHSGAAHFELAWLFANKQSDPAAAIYHYERYLQLRPRAENADTIRQHILGLKQELAKAVLPLPSSPGVQRQLEQLMEANKRLTEEVEKWRAYYADRGAAPQTNAIATLPDPGRQSVAMANPVAQPGGALRSPENRVAASSTSRTHRVESGDTPFSVAQKYHVKLDALMSANPGLNPRRMQVGQVLNLPVP